MTAKLSQELQEALQHNGDRPIQVVDPATNKVYFLIAGDMYERVKSLIFENEFDIRDTYAAQFAGLDTPECWDAPGMELYDDYDAHKPQP